MVRNNKVRLFSISSNHWIVVNGCFPVSTDCQLLDCDILTFRVSVAHFELSNTLPSLELSLWSPASRIKQAQLRHATPSMCLTVSYYLAVHSFYVCQMVECEGTHLTRPVFSKRCREEQIALRLVQVQNNCEKDNRTGDSSNLCSVLFHLSVVLHLLFSCPATD